MVLGVCRRVLPNPHDADDAFQAAFFILARKAGSRTWRPSVGPWLHLVAHRLALRIRSAAQRRTRYETQLLTRPPDDPLATITGRELCAVIDGELNALPERLRAPLVLCCLEGQTRDEAARHLGWSLATLKRRLDEGRERLRLRLERRGFQLPAALAGVLVADGVSRGQVPPTLIQSLTRAAQAGAAPSPRVLALMEAFLRGTLYSRLRTVTVVFLMAGFLSVSAGGLGLMLNWPQPADEPQAKAESDKPKAKFDGVRVDAYGDPLPEGAVIRLGTSRLRHPGQLIPYVAFLPNGRLLTSNDDGMVRVWDSNTGKELRKWHAHDRNMYWGFTGGMAVSADSKLVATSDRRVIHISDIATGKVVRRIKAAGGVSEIVERDISLTFSPNGKWLAGGIGRLSGPGGSNPNPVVVWSVETGEQVCSLPGYQQGPPSLIFTPDGRSLISAGFLARTIQFWDPVIGKKQRQLEVGQDDRLRTLALSADGKILAAGGSHPQPPTRQATIWLWDASAGKELCQIQGTGYDVYVIALSPSGKLMASMDNSGFVLWNVTTGKELWRIEAKQGSLARMAFSQDEKILAIAAGPTIRLWDVATGKELAKREGPVGAVYPMAYSPDGRLLASGSPSIWIWDTATGRTLRSLGGHDSYVSTLAFTPDGKTIVSGGGDNTVRLWNVTTGQETRSFAILPEHDPERGIWGAQVRAKKLSSDGTTLYVLSEQVNQGKASSHLLSAWDVIKGKRLFQRAEEIPAWLISPSGHYLVTPRSHDGGSNTVLVTDLATGKRICSLIDLKELYWGPFVFSPDEKVIALVCHDRPATAIDSVTVSSIHLYELATGKERRTWTVLESVTDLAFAPDGRVLASGSRDAIRFWDVAAGQEIFKRTGHDVEVRSLGFAPDGQTLASVLYDTTVLLWKLTPEISRARAAVREPVPADVLAMWTDLGSADAAKGQAAILAFIESPRDAVPFLAKQLRPAAVPGKEQLGRLIADLDSPAFDTREMASRELERQAELAEPLLRQALANDPSPETRRRIEALLSKLVGPLTSDEMLRPIRAIEILEHLATPQARQLLQKLATGAPEARLSREAKAALERLDQRGR